MKWVFCLFLFAGLEKFLEEVKIQLRPHTEEWDIVSRGNACKTQKTGEKAGTFYK